jgi:tight adherence protein B
LVFFGLFGVAAVAMIGRLEASTGRANLKRRLSGPPTIASHDADESAGADRAPNSITSRTVGLADRMVVRRGLGDQLSDSLATAAINVRPGEWLLLHVISSTCAGITLWLLSGLSPAAGAVGFVIGFALPQAVLRIRRDRRRRTFYASLPDTLQLVAGSLSVGHSLAQSLASVASQSTGPMADELNRALVQVRLGTDLEVALESIAQRMASADMAWVVMAIRIQREVGGNLAEVLTTLAGTLRERERIRRQVQALSAEGRLSAVILGALPILLALYLVVLRPDYIVLLINNALGLALLVTCSVMFVLGMLWMRAVVRIKV